MFEVKKYIKNAPIIDGKVIRRGRMSLKTKGDIDETLERNGQLV